MAGSFGSSTGPRHLSVGPYGHSLYLAFPQVRAERSTWKWVSLSWLARLFYRTERCSAGC